MGQKILALFYSHIRAQSTQFFFVKAGLLFLFPIKAFLIIWRQEQVLQQCMDEVYRFPGRY